VGAPISLDGVAVHPDCWCICLCYLHFAPENPEDGKMYLLVPAHPGCPGQSPESRKMVVCCVCVCVYSRCSAYCNCRKLVCSNKYNDNNYHVAITVTISRHSEILSSNIFEHSSAIFSFFLLYTSSKQIIPADNDTYIEK